MPAGPVKHIYISRAAVACRKTIQKSKGRSLMKKALTDLVFAFALVFCLWLQPAVTLTDTGGSCGDSESWTLDGNGLPTISGEGPMAVLPGNIDIADTAFEDCGE